MKNIVKIHFHSFRKRKIKNLVHHVTNFSLNTKCKIDSVIFFKSKPFKKFTILSSPHVYKKSRKQYVIYKYKSLVNVSIPEKKDLKEIYMLKSRMIDNNLDQGVNLNFEFIKREKMRLASLCYNLED